MNFNKKLQKKLAKKKALLAGDTDLQFSDDCELVIHFIPPLQILHLVLFKNIFFRI